MTPWFSVSRPARWGLGLHSRGSSICAWPFALIVLSVLRKKCLEDDINTDEDDMAITHHDDLQLIKDVVRLSQNAGLIPP
jgi:hypothetical protein